MASTAFTVAGVPPGGLVTGIATVGTTLYAVSNAGGLYAVGNPTATVEGDREDAHRSLGEVRESTFMSVYRHATWALLLRMYPTAVREVSIEIESARPLTLRARLVAIVTLPLRSSPERSNSTLTVPLGPGAPGVFAGSLETDEIGLYRIAHGDVETLAHVGPVNAPEFTDTVSTTPGAIALTRTPRGPNSAAAVRTS